MATAQEAPEGERLAKVEADVESLVRETGEVRADLRNLRSEVQSVRVEMQSGLDRVNARIDRNFLWTLGVMITMWVSIIVAIIVAILVD